MAKIDKPGEFPKGQSCHLQIAADFDWSICFTI
jgi:hypothetical protein